jgi:hypothetical protein
MYKHLLSRGVDTVRLALGAVIAPMVGHYNQSGTVNAADYVVWRKTSGQAGAGLAADGIATAELPPPTTTSN